MKFGNYNLFDKVNEQNAKIILEQMRNNLANDLIFWKTQSPSEMAKLMQIQIEAIDIALDKLENNIMGEKKERCTKDKI